MTAHLVFSFESDEQFVNDNVLHGPGAVAVVDDDDFVAAFRLQGHQLTAEVDEEVGVVVLVAVLDDASEQAAPKL